MKNPLKLEEVFEAINEKLGFDFKDIKNMLDEEVDFEQVEEYLLNNSLSPLMLSCYIQMDIFFFTPLSYYLQLINLSIPKCIIS